MAFTLRKILGAAIFAASFIPGVAQVKLAAAGLRLGGTLILQSARRKGAAERQEGITSAGPSSMGAVPVVYGTAKLGVRVADIRVDPVSDENRDMYIVASICHGGRRTGGSGGIDDILQVRFDEILAVNNGAVQAPYTTTLTYTEHLGTDTQTVDATLNSVFSSEWPATSKGLDVAYIVLQMEFDKDIYLTGIPNLTVLVQGNQVYDHRDSQWKFSDNPALCIRDYLLSTVYGGGVDASEIDEDSFDDMADFCDVLVSVPDGASGFENQKRFTCNGWVDTSRSVPENIPELLSSCRGMLIFQDGKYRLHIPRDMTGSIESFELTEDNIIGDWEFNLAGLAGVANIVRATHIDPAQNYQPVQVQWPEPGEANAYLTADNDFEALREIELPFTNNVYMAEQICQIALTESRQNIMVAVSANEAAKVLQAGDVVPLSHSTPGWSSKEFWVDAVFLLQDGNLRLALREYDASAYSLDTMSDAAALPNTNLPNPFTAAAPTNLTLLSDVTTAITSGTGGPIPRIKVTWTAPDDPFIDYVEVLARLNGESDWEVNIRVDRVDNQLAWILDVSAGDTWEVGVRATNTLKKQSSLVTDTVVIPDPTEQPHVNDPPDAPSVLVLTASIEKLLIID